MSQLSPAHLQSSARRESRGSKQREQAEGAWWTCRPPDCADWPGRTLHTSLASTWRDRKTSQVSLGLTLTRDREMSLIHYSSHNYNMRTLVMTMTWWHWSWLWHEDTGHNYVIREWLITGQCHISNVEEDSPAQYAGVKVSRRLCQNKSNYFLSDTSSKESKGTLYFQH